MRPGDTIFIPGPTASVTLDAIQTSQRQNVERVQQALVDIHRRASQVNNAVRATDVWQHTRSKLRVKWCGPAQVVGTVSNWVFEIQNLVTGQRKEAHASRLKFYADSSLNVNEDLLQHIAHNSEGHIVESLLKARYNKNEKCHEIKVHWRGLDALEDLWERC
ncbi:hypothetical protein GN958_ATG14653 [Phytophthora infestans]|uniref:Chromo domain-containing protein n=1 Tax=Phytophthora infestans TaxID=4787 RepID=A0A8S9U6I0_PHYIN|nr:hypothetical protein GN958_ATG14653 [Phytophthora infestans]